MAEILITGSGMLAGGLASAVGERGLGYSVLSRAELDVTDRDAVLRKICAGQPRLVLHTAALTRVNQCEADPDLAFEVNARGTEHVVSAAIECGASVVLFSTDYVFDGSQATGWVETDRPAPLNVYGKSKLAAEQAVLACDRGMVIRTSGVFGRRHDGLPERNFFKAIAEKVTSGKDKIPVVCDQFTAVSYAPDLGKMVLEAVESGLGRILHLVCSGSDSWAGWAGIATGILGFDPDRIEPVPSKTQFTGTMRPMYSVLKSGCQKISDLSRQYPAVSGLQRYLSGS